MSVKISSIEEKEINLAPESVLEEVVQNVWFILSTIQGECPLARGLGLNPSYIDKPIETAKALATAQIYEQVAEYEPRAVIVGITFDTDNDGILYTTVEVSVDGNSNIEDE